MYKPKYEITEAIIRRNDCMASKRTIKPRGVMVHSIGVAQPDPWVIRNSWNRTGVEAAAHAIIGPHDTIQMLPWDHRGWHAGGKANNTHVSFEISEPAGHGYNGGTMVGYDVKKNEAFFQAIYARAVDLAAYLCSMYNLDPMAPGVLICHSEGHALGIATNHADVMHWWPKHGKNMDDLRRDVAWALRRPAPSPIEEEDEDTFRFDRIDQMPPYAQPVIMRLVDKGYIGGKGTGRKDAAGRPADLDLSLDMIRLLVIQDRAGMYK